MPRKTDSNNPADWLFLAESDLEGIRALAGQEISFYLCQSKPAEVLEKVLKAALIQSGWVLEKTHDVQKLTDELHRRKSPLAMEAQPLAEALAESYFAERYPGFDLDDPNWPELRKKIAAVSRLLTRIKGTPMP